MKSQPLGEDHIEGIVIPHSYWNLSVEWGVLQWRSSEGQVPSESFQLDKGAQRKKKKSMYLN